MAGLNGHHQAKVMKDAFSSTEAKGFFCRGREKKIKGAALLCVSLGGKGQRLPWCQQLHEIKREDSTLTRPSVHLPTLADGEGTALVTTWHKKDQAK